MESTQNSGRPANPVAAGQKRGRGPNVKDPSRIPNPAIKGVRTAIGLSQKELGKRLDVTQSYVANLETGRYPITLSFAVKIAANTGVDAACVMKRASTPLDLDGRPYTSVSYRAFQEARKEVLSKDDYGRLIRPIQVAFHAAADIGRLKVFTNVLNATLGETIEAVDGLKEAIGKRLEAARKEAEAKARARRFTFGELRENNSLARSLGFEDNPERQPHEVAFEIRRVDLDTFTSPAFNASFDEDNPLWVEFNDEKGRPSLTALFGGKPAMSENDVAYIKGLLNRRKAAKNLGTSDSSTQE